MKTRRFNILCCIIFGLLISIFFCLNKCVADSNDTTATARIFLNIKAGALIIGTNDNSSGLINLVGNMGTTVTGRFDSGAFWVYDQNGATKYWTTISATDLTSGTGDDIKRISAERIKIKAGDGPTLITGDSNTGLMINPQLSEYKSINNPVRYFYNNERNGILGKYGDNPEISIDIPSNISFGCTVINPCDFRGTITYTLYEE